MSDARKPIKSRPIHDPVDAWHPEAEEGLTWVAKPQTVPIYRKTQIGAIDIGPDSSGENVTVAALKTIVQFVSANSSEPSPITDAYEFQAGEHRVQLKLGDEVIDNYER